MLSNKEKLSQKLKTAKQGRQKKKYIDKQDTKLLQQVETLVQTLKTKELQDLKKKDIDEYEQKLQHMFPNLSKNNSAIFKMTISGGIDINMLKYMIHQKNLIKKGNTNQYKSDVKVGQILADTFIKNKI